MLFNSLHFLVFFPIVFFLYFSIPPRWRNVLLLAASVYFYMTWRPAYILIILGTVSIDYIAALSIERASSAARRKLFLAASLAGNLLILFTFKYFDFFAASINQLAAWGGAEPLLPIIELILPLGISFHTFQAMGYAIDVYRGRMPAERSFFRYILFVLFFPQLVAGPIERAGHMLGQFSECHDFDYRRVTDGLKRAAWGLFKKVVIADRLAAFVDYVYADPTQFTGMPLVIATIFFAFQIYCDFSGYTDIALGTAQMLGFRLMENFKRPYFAKSIPEFWSRWHISLSTWFKDYVYIPLGGSRNGPNRHLLALFLTFLVSGLWHGASWTFVAWGALNGAYMIASVRTGALRQRIAEASGLAARPRLRAVFQIAVTFFLTCIAWVFFRAHSLDDALYVLTHAASGFGEWFRHLAAWDIEYLKRNLLLGQRAFQFGVALAALGLMEAVHVLQRRGSLRERIAGQAWPLRWMLYAGVVLAILFFGRFGERLFIYFTF